jgi:hypothetical protein
MSSAFAAPLLVAFLVLAPTVATAKPVEVEVLYMNHGPLQPTLEQVRAVFAKYGPRIAVVWHDSETDDGRAFMARKNLSGHIPLVIWLDGTFKHTRDGKEVSFTGFPTGAGPAFFQGKWTTDDLRRVLDRLTARK